MTLWPDRYDRQMTLPEIGADGQAKLARVRMLVVGAGGDGGGGGGGGGNGGGG